MIMENVNDLLSWIERIWATYRPPRWISVSIVALFAYYKYTTWHFGIFRKLKIKGPRPVPVFGNAISLMSKGFKSDLDLRSYGQFVGIFQGRDPTLVIFDVDILKDVLVKDFSSFQNRFVPVEMDYPFNYMLISVKDDHWKHIRSMMTPSFSTGKIRRMQDHIDKCIESLMNNLQQKADANEKLKFKDYCDAYMLDLIASTAFGMQVDSHSDPNNVFVRMSKKLFQFSFADPKMFLFFFFPFLIGPLRKVGFSFFPKDALNFYVSVVDSAVKERRMATDDDQKVTDFLQLMVNAYIDDTETDIEDIDEYTGEVRRWSQKGLTYNEIIAQGMLFMLAGFDTTSTTASLLAYSLAVNQDCQEKLINEIDDIMSDQASVTHDIVQKMPYLDQCISEVLRLYPPAPRTDRVASRDVVLGGKLIPKGMVIGIPVYALHMDADVWPEPETFNPDRFSPDQKAARNPYYYMPFGVGPRNCIGMRLAMMEIKMATVRILQKFRFQVSEDTTIPIKVDLMMRPVDGAMICVESR